MIPKQLFFIWFGNLPDYAKYSIDSFKKMNPDFCVDVIQYTVDEAINCDDSLLSYCRELIVKTHKGIDNKYYQYIKHRIDSKFNFVQILSDFLRFELLRCYGGIYLDCDTFPVKPFDDELMNMSSFSQSVLALKPKKYPMQTLHEDYTYYYDYDFKNNLSDYLLYMYTDIYFVGSRKNFDNNDFVFTESAVCKNPLTPPWIRNFDNDKVFLEHSKKFYKMECELYKEHIFYSQYILHFCKRSWQKDYRNTAMYSEMDDYLYGKQ